MTWCTWMMGSGEKQLPRAGKLLYPLPASRVTMLASFDFYTNGPAEIKSE